MEHNLPDLPDFTASAGLHGDDHSGGISRRTLMKGAAWAVPAVALASAAPAFALSNCAQAVLSTDGTWTKNKYVNSQVAETEPSYFDMWVDSVDIIRGAKTGTIHGYHPANPDAQAIVTWTSNAITGVTEGCKYPVSMTVSTQAGTNPGYQGTDNAGNSGSCAHFNTNLQLQWSSDGSSWQDLGPLISTQSVGGGSVVVAPPAPVPAGGGNGCLGHTQGGTGFGTPQTVNAGSITPTANGIYFRMVYTMWGNGSTDGQLGNNDDYHVTLAFGDCSCH